MRGLKFNDPIYQERIKSVLGHKFVEALGGIILGIAVALVYYWIMF